ncbi:MAG: hypothetical protein NZM04_01310 [Methylacidiphilales bacterium]|nr:hypothetical protein [Candidatus Methylacidiphilales bacterium]MDW8349346.1 hypothetical protein [Verrucomicrobiae bacterium]
MLKARPASFILATWGTFLLHATLSGQTTALFHPIFIPIIFSASLILLTLSFLLLYYTIPPPDTPPSPPFPADPTGQEEFPLTHLKPTPARLRLTSQLAPTLLILLLTLPLLTAKILAPDTFSEIVLQNRALPNAADLWKRTTAQSFADLIHTWQQIPHDDPIPLDVREILLAGADPHGRSILEGRRVEVIGQTQPLTPTTFHISRFLMLCCAADAVPLSITAIGELPESPSRWHKITGRLYYEPLPEDLQLPTAQHRIPFEPKIEVEHITPTPPPRQPFLY